MLDGEDPASIRINVDFLGRTSVTFVGDGKVRRLSIGLCFLERLPGVTSFSINTKTTKTVDDFLVFAGCYIAGIMSGGKADIFAELLIITDLVAVFVGAPVGSLYVIGHGGGYAVPDMNRKLRMVEATECLVFSVFVHMLTFPKDVGYVLDLLTTVSAEPVGGGDIGKVVFRPSTTTCDVAVHPLLLIPQVVDYLLGQRDVYLIKLIEMGAFVRSLAVTGSDTDVNDGLLEVLPWHVEYVNIGFTILLDNKLVSEVGVVLMQFLNEHGDRTSSIYMLGTMNMVCMDDVRNQVSSFREFGHKAFEGSDPLNQYVDTRVQVT